MVSRSSLDERPVRERMGTIEGYLLSVVRGRSGLTASVIRGLLGGLAYIYCLGLEIFLLPYRIGLRKRFRLPCFVVSVGNLSVGGTGKTPMSQTLCRDLLAGGQRVAILSRGYGGGFERGCAVVSDGVKVRLTAQEAGDEAYLLAKTLPGVPVVVGKDRRATGTLAVGQFHPDLIVLDDGLQYWQLHRDLDIVLLNACDPFDNGWTFPRGLLREPPRHLARAGIVVLTHTSRAGKEQVAEVIASVRRLAPDRPIFTANLTPYGLRSLMDQSTFPIDWLEGRRVAAVSALGNPDGFEAMIGDLGGVVAARFRYRDHQAITVAELDAICEEAGRGDAEALITTEKDAVKMAPLRNRLPILALQVRMQVDDERRFLRAVAEAREGYVT